MTGNGRHRFRKGVRIPKVEQGPDYFPGQRPASGWSGSPRRGQSTTLGPPEVFLAAPVSGVPWLNGVVLFFA